MMRQPVIANQSADWCGNPRLLAGEDGLPRRFAPRNDKRMKIALLFLLCLTLAGCGDRLLERSYSTVTPHSAAYRETEDADTLRAENYQDLVNALLMLLGEHSESGVVRVYGDAPDKAALAERACVEVQQETALGAYLLDYITYDGAAENGYYELTARFGYRRTAEEQMAIVNATSVEALPDLLRAAVEAGASALAVRVGHFDADRADVLAQVTAVHDELYAPEDAPWEVRFYPDNEQPGILEVLLEERS